MTEFRMPSLGADMTEGTLLHWLVHTGDVVHKGDIVAEVDTTKAAIEIECFDDGVIGEIRVPEGRTVPVGAVLATIDTAAVGSPTTTGLPAAERLLPVEPLPEPGGVAAGSSAEAVAGGRTGPPSAQASEAATSLDGHQHPPARTTPLIRQLAEQAGLDVATLRGSGPSGRIMRVDVERAARQQDISPPRADRPNVPESVRPEDAADPEIGKPAVSGADSGRRPTGEVSAAPPARTGAHVRASGLARRLASMRGIDLSTVTGSGPDRAVHATDVRAASEEPGVRHQASEPAAVITPAPATSDAAGTHDVAAMRTMIAAAMVRSKQTVPHYYLSETIDVSAPTAWLRAENRTVSVASRILLPALLFRAIAGAAQKVPQLNGHWIEDEFRPATAVHLGVVVSLRGGGIIVPTIPGAGTLDPPAMMAALRGVVERARSGRLRSGDVTPATITVTNLGDLGVDSVFGVIAAPQVAIVGLGAVAERPSAVGGLLGVRPQLTATLSADHRASDGATGARFLHAVADLLQRPEEL
ncbi:2-oxo acid dehydrogenase subunit E2 [Nocardia australiensis]|uniref:2-oxo acid dehydrogenase subunit E2 n=1 Tax=Nocardia australiensis TaxID=2887191 RepID=UPI001D150034|nr:2-oxo acid dehydrogenase subunit E2 [Nocardia australiensis]